MSFIDYVLVITNFLVSNDINISKIHQNQGKKFHDLFLKKPLSKFITLHNPDKMVCNFLRHVLNTPKKSLPSKGSNFVISLKNINYSDYMLPSELLHRDDSSLEVSNLDEAFIKSSLKESDFSIYRSTGNFFEKNSSKVEFDALTLFRMGLFRAARR